MYGLLRLAIRDICGRKREQSRYPRHMLHRTKNELNRARIREKNSDFFFVCSVPSHGSITVFFSYLLLQELGAAAGCLPWCICRRGHDRRRLQSRLCVQILLGGRAEWGPIQLNRRRVSILPPDRRSAGTCRSAWRGGSSSSRTCGNRRRRQQQSEREREGRNQESVGQVQSREPGNQSEQKEKRKSPLALGPVEDEVGGAVGAPADLLHHLVLLHPLPPSLPVYGRRRILVPLSSHLRGGGAAVPGCCRCDLRASRADGRGGCASEWCA